MFGYIGVAALWKGAVRVGRLHPYEISRAIDPANFWIYTGASIVLATAGIIQLIRNLKAHTEPHS